MNSWLEFEKRFRSLSELLTGLRLDFQWGVEGQRWRLAGRSTEEFEGLVILAGQSLEQCLDVSTRLGQIILAETTFVERWYRAVKELSCKFTDTHVLACKDEKGNTIGYIYLGSIYNIVEVSADTCLKLQAYYPLKIRRYPTGFSVALNSDGGPIVLGDVHTRGGNFVGRDSLLSPPSKDGTLSREEKELLIAADGDEGQVFLIHTEQADWIRIGGRNYHDTRNPALATVYLEALEALVERGYAKHESDISYKLTSSGRRQARELRLDQ